MQTLPTRRSSSGRRKSVVSRPVWQWVAGAILALTVLVLLGFAWRGTNSDLPYSGLVESLTFKQQSELEHLIRTHQDGSASNSTLKLAKPKHNVAVVMRTYGPPTLFKKEFLLNLTHQLGAKTLPFNEGKKSPYDVWVLHDTTPKPPPRGPISRLKAQFAKLATYLFGAGAVQSSSAKAQKQLTDIEMWDGFAAQHNIGVVHYNISQILAMFNRTRHLTDKAYILAWALHEPTLLYFEDAARADKARRYDHIWFVEDDVFFTGNMATFFDFYGQNSADLVTALLEPSDSWWNTWAGPLSSVPLIDWRNVWYSHEHVVRLSAHLLQAIRELHTLNVVLYGEAYAPTVCNAMVSWCKVHSITGDPFYNEQLYTVHGYSDQQVTPELYDLLWTKPAFANKWVHGMKRNDPRKCERGIMCA